MDGNSIQEFVIRPIQVNDTPDLLALSERSGLFKSDELWAIQNMLDDYHAVKSSSGHRIITCEVHKALLGIAYVAPREFADRVWELLMIAVDAAHQRKRIGTRLLGAIESHVAAEQGRLLLIETSDQIGFERTREFYRKHGYAEVAHIPDYFTDGDGKASFVKRLPTAPATELLS